MPNASTLMIAFLKARSLLRLAMRRQLVDYMRAHNIEALCLQGAKSKHATQYVVDNYICMTFSTTRSNQQEHTGVGFPFACSALVRVQPVNSRIASVLKKMYRYLWRQVGSISLTRMFSKTPCQKMNGGLILNSFTPTLRD